MQQAKRLYSKRSNNAQHSPSPAFLSNIPRTQSQVSDSPGPGHYDVALPIIKPQYQALITNHNTIIVKVNVGNTPAFKSNAPRFTSTKKEKQTIENEQFHDEQDDHQILKSNKINKQIKQRIKRIAQLFKLEEEGQMQVNDGKAINVSNRSHNDTSTIPHYREHQYTFNNENGQQMINGIKLYKKQKERVKFILKQMKRRDKGNGKGSEWSRYKERQHATFQAKTLSPSPGPGAYPNSLNSISTSANNLPQSSLLHSWQFRSNTQRNPIKSQKDQSIIATSLQNGVSGVIHSRYNLNP